MEGFPRCIECGGAVNVTRPTPTERTEECRECGRKSHWRVCAVCGEVNGPRRVICMECGQPFETKAVLIAPRPKKGVAGAPGIFPG